MEWIYKFVEKSVEKSKEPVVLGKEKSPAKEIGLEL